jgi:hypothetical protein
VSADLLKKGPATAAFRKRKYHRSISGGKLAGQSQDLPFRPSKKRRGDQVNNIHVVSIKLLPAGPYPGSIL